MFFQLYIVATPIGNLRDVSYRALDVLKTVDVVLCEDTRVSVKLLQNFGITVSLMVYNDHNAIQVIPNIIKTIKSDSKTFALISDAGTPLISDPGYKLVNACIENDIKYTVIPGASAVISALVLSGFPTDRFMFAGFADLTKFAELSKINSTLIFYESPNRILKTLENMKLIFKNRTVAVIKEMTKIHETVIRGDFDCVISYFSQNKPKGEFVVLLSPPYTTNDEKLNELKPLISALSAKMSKKDICSILANYYGIAKNTIYNYMKENLND